MTMQARCDINETKEASINGYFHGLRIDIQHIIAFQHFDSINEVIQHAIQAEEIANYQIQKFRASKWAA